MARDSGGYGIGPRKLAESRGAWKEGAHRGRGRRQKSIQGERVGSIRLAHQTELPKFSATHCERDESEIEVTPEMIETGLDEWAVHDERFEPRECELASIYRAMATLTISPLALDKLGPRGWSHGE